MPTFANSVRHGGFAAIVCAAGAVAQATTLPAVDADPYTGGDVAAMERAGIVGYGPFRLSRYHDSEEVDALFGGRARIRWLETAHFKIGSALTSYRVPQDPKQRRKLRAELAALRDRLPAVPADTRTLDPWLRLHLIARRAEATYAEFRDRLGCCDEDFPPPGSRVSLGPNYLGIGPYLGQKQKYIVLVTQRVSQYARYTERYLGAALDWPKRWNFGWNEGLFFGTAAELAGHLADDTGMHCHLVYNVVQNLCDGYRHFNHEIPVWFKCGLAQWYLRRVDPRYNNFDRPPDRDPDYREASDWRKKLRGLIANDAIAPIDELLTRRDYSGFRFIDYMVCWSLIDFLQQRGGDAAIAQFLHEIKYPFGNGGQPPKWDDVLARQEAALGDAFELDIAALDRAWRTWAEREYRSR